MRNSMTEASTVQKSECSTKRLQYQKLPMRSRGTKEVAAMDNCFALIRARQHCIAKYYVNK